MHNVNHKAGVFAVLDTVYNNHKDESYEKVLGLMMNAVEGYCNTQNQGLFIPVVHFDELDVIHQWYKERGIM